jgi:signal peptidase II
MLQKFLRDYRFLFLTSGLVVATDQFTKYLVRMNLAISDQWSPWPWLMPYARLVHWKNTGAVFGIFQGLGDVFTVLAIVVSIAIIFYFPRVPGRDWYIRLAMGLQLGGAIGNLIDRLTLGYVIDFISVMRFAVFNVADSCISIGVVLLVVGVWVRDQQNPSKITTSGEYPRQVPTLVEPTIGNPGSENQEPTHKETVDG